MYRSHIKRLIDFVCAFTAFMVFSPLMVFITMVIRSRLGTPALFKQPRPGLHGRPFTILKFRTMRDALDASGRPLADAERLTPIGRLLRSTSLDELPELINVIKGEMSLVGPRPLLMKYLNRYTPSQAIRHEVKPGLTGWAQVNGRNSLEWEDRFKMDLWYVENVSFRLDLKIIVMTLKKVLMREGINREGEATMTEFMGTRWE